MRRILFIIISLLILSTAGCSLYRTTHVTSHDYNLTGFLTDEVFQILIIEKPDSGKEGLVRQRESAFMKASSNARHKAVMKYTEYMVDLYLKSHRENTFTKGDYAALVKTIESFSLLIHPAFEYYLDDNSVVLGYRLHTTNLKRRTIAVIVSILNKKKRSNP
jgi:hypothetical protein